MCSGLLTFFDFPYDVQIEILSHLDLKDISQFALTCNKAQALIDDRFLWKKVLWNCIKAVKFDSTSMHEDCIPQHAEIIIHNEAMDDLQELFKSLNPQEHNSFELLQADPGMTHSRLLASTSQFSTKKLNHYFMYFFSLFQRQPKVNLNDPFTVGMSAPSFLLFGPPETKLSKKFIFSLIASKGSSFEPVGLVKGKPGGIGGGMTVNLKGKVMNFIPVRRARRGKLLVGEGSNATFHQDVVNVAKGMDGLIYYFDARCCCQVDANSSSHRRKKSKAPSPSVTKASSHSHQDLAHDLSSDMHELRAMLKSLEGHLSPPVLVVMISIDRSSGDPSELSCQSDHSDEFPSVRCSKHRPRDLIPYLSSYKCTWLVRNVYMPSLQGVCEGFNWLLLK